MLSQIKLFSLALTILGSLALTRAGSLLDVRDSASFSIEVFGPVGKRARFINSGDWKDTSAMTSEGNFGDDNEFMRDVDYERIGTVNFNDLSAGTETQVLSVVFEKKGIACTAKLNQDVDESKMVKFYVTEETYVIGDENKDLVTFECGYEEIKPEDTDPKFSLRVWTPAGKKGYLTWSGEWQDGAGGFYEGNFNEPDKFRDETQFEKIGDSKFYAEAAIGTVKMFNVLIFDENDKTGLKCEATLAKPVQDTRVMNIYIKTLTDVDGEYEKGEEDENEDKDFISFECDLSPRTYE